jgi:hypothetical protein
MLLLDSRSWEFDGVSVFPDHADPAQFYYMPLSPHLTTRKDGSGAEFPQFSLIRFKGQAGTGGLLNFDVNLGLSDDRLRTIKSALQREANLPGEARLAPVPVVDGSVHLLMLGEDSSEQPEEGEDRPETPGALRFVETMDHPAKPSLYGINQATFSVQLAEDGVKVLLQSIEGEILPIAVVYSLQYLGLRPAYSVRLNIDWDRVQKHMDETFGANTLFVSTEIGSAVDELVEKRAIVFEADSFIADDGDGDTAVAGRRDAAIAQVRAMITDTFFQPSLPPWKAGQGDTWADDLKKAADVVSLIAAGPAAGATSKSLFSYKKMEYTRTDRKSLNVNFSERTTVKRSIFPQGHLAGLFEQLRAPGVDRSRYIISVDLDDPWFKRRKLTVFAQTDFAADKIGSINVRARYGDQPKNAILKKGAETAVFDWTSILDGPNMRMPVELEYEVAFENVDATERPGSVKSSPEMEDGEQVGIDPRKLYAMSTVPIVAVNFPWAVYPMVEVHVRYLDPANNLAQAELFRLTDKAQEATWSIFILNPTLREFEYRLVFRAADQTHHETDWAVSDEEQITVTDPFPRKRELAVVAAVDWEQYDRCFVDVSYRDPANGVDEQRSLELVAGDRSKTVVFEMQNPEQRTVSYRVTFLGKTGTTIEIPESETKEARIIVRPDMKGRRLVEVRPPADFAAQRLTKVTADLRFEDFAAGLTFNGNFVFEPGAGPRFFEYDYVDPGRARYERRVSYLFDNGMQQVADWGPGDGPVLQLAAP